MSAKVKRLFPYPKLSRKRLLEKISSLAKAREYFSEKTGAMEKNVWGVLIQTPLGTQGKRNMPTPTAPKHQNEVVLIQKHRNLRHPQGLVGEGARWGVYYRKKSGSKY